MKHFSGRQDTNLALKFTVLLKKSLHIMENLLSNHGV